MNKRTFSFLAITLLSACTSQVLTTTATKSYAVGQRVFTSVGSPILRIEKGDVKTIRRWVGILNSPDGWQLDQQYSHDYVKGELIYSGVSGKTIEIAYREYRGNLAAPAFFQSLKYDLAESAYITFQNFRIQVITANNSGIDTVLVSDGFH